MRKNIEKTLKGMSIFLVTTVIVQKINYIIINIVKGSDASARNIEMIFVVESIALVIAIIGIATNNYKRMFFGFGGYYMYAVCGIIIQMLSAGQIMETIDKVRLFVNFVILLVLVLTMAKAIKPFVTSTVVEIMVIIELVINISQIFPATGSIFDTVQALTNAMAMFAVGEAITITCRLAKNNNHKRQISKKEIV